jgi:hypothetical protein
MKRIFLYSASSSCSNSFMHARKPGTVSAETRFCASNGWDDVCPFRTFVICARPVNSAAQSRCTFASALGMTSSLPGWAGNRALPLRLEQGVDECLARDCARLPCGCACL